LYHIIFEVALVLWIVKLVFTKRNKHDRPVLTEQEKEELIREWQPDPLVPEVPEDDRALKAANRVVNGPIAKYVDIEGKKCLNLATLNFLNLVGSKRIEEVAIRTLRKYGVGSCGPRGFYGTMDVHLELEERLAKFMNCEEAAIFSFGFSTVSTIIPAYAKRTDIIYCDAGANFAIQQGVKASKSRVKLFRHNDMTDLERLMSEQAAADKRDPKRAKNTRQFVIVEGIYINYGDTCPLPKLVELKYKYKVRLFVDESISFGTLGSHGRGVTEFYKVPISDIDLTMGSLEYAIGSIGGFSVGTKYVVDHQRLSALGYCFSASAPPLLVTSAIEALNVIEADSGIDVLNDLHRKVRILHKALESVRGIRVDGNSEVSPILHLRIDEEQVSINEGPVGEGLDRSKKMEVLERTCDLALENGLAITVARYLDNEERVLPEPSIRLAVNVDLSESEIDTAVRTLTTAVERAFREAHFTVGAARA
jgi:serine palmitoyltransferase